MIAVIKDTQGLFEGLYLVVIFGSRSLHTAGETPHPGIGSAPHDHRRATTVITGKLGYLLLFFWVHHSTVLWGQAKSKILPVPAPLIALLIIQYRPGALSPPRVVVLRMTVKTVATF